MDRLSHDHARQLDQQDELASYRTQFAFPDPDLIYLDGNSLGRMPIEVNVRMDTAIRDQWGARLVRAWNEGWWEAPLRIGEQIAPLLGAAAGQIIVGDQTSVNLFKLAIAALKLRPGKLRIVTDTFNFPSDL